MQGRYDLNCVIVFHVCKSLVVSAKVYQAIDPNQRLVK